MDLSDLFKGRVSVVCAGNEFNADDRLGLELHGRLSDIKDPDLQVLYTSTAPENFIGEILDFKPERAVVVDAGDFGGRPGEICVLDLAELESSSISTHRMPLRVFAKRLKEEGVDTSFIGIQARDFTTGEPMSEEVEAAAGRLVGIIKETRSFV